MCTNNAIPTELPIEQTRRDANVFGPFESNLLHIPYLHRSQSARHALLWLIREQSPRALIKMTLALFYNVLYNAL